MGVSYPEATSIMSRPGSSYAAWSLCNASSGLGGQRAIAHTPEPRVCYRLHTFCLTESPGGWSYPWLTACRCMKLTRLCIGLCITTLLAPFICPGSRQVVLFNMSLSSAQNVCRSSYRRGCAFVHT